MKLKIGCWDIVQYFSNRPNTKTDEFKIHVPLKPLEQPVQQIVSVNRAGMVVNKQFHKLEGSLKKREIEVVQFMTINTPDLLRNKTTTLVGIRNDEFDTDNVNWYYSIIVTLPDSIPPLFKYDVKQIEIREPFPLVHYLVDPSCGQ